MLSHCLYSCMRSASVVAVQCVYLHAQCAYTCNTMYLQQHILTPYALARHCTVQEGGDALAAGAAADVNGQHDGVQEGMRDEAR